MKDGGTSWGRRGSNSSAATLTLLAFALLCSSASHADVFRSPVACEDCINWYYYFDQDPGNGILDWDCQQETYDGHRGTDYSLRGGNSSIDDGYDVVAMADGVVLSSEDGYFDRCTNCGGENCGLDFGNGFANQVRIDHGDYVVIYGHMRLGSILVTEGDTVTCGQPVGQIGSSGCSSAAHLHIEPVPPGGSFRDAVDPYEGECSTTESSLFTSQTGYRELPGIECSTSNDPDGSGGAANDGIGGNNGVAGSGSGVDGLGGSTGAAGSGASDVAGGGATGGAPADRGDDAGGSSGAAGSGSNTDNVGGSPDASGDETDSGGSTSRGGLLNNGDDSEAEVSGVDPGGLMGSGAVATATTPPLQPTASGGSDTAATPGDPPEPRTTADTETGTRQDPTQGAAPHGTGDLGGSQSAGPHGAEGCGCSLPDREPGSTGALVSAALLLLGLVRRRAWSGAGRYEPS